MAVDGIVHKRVVPEMLHDVNLAPIGPIYRLVDLWHHPDGRPKALRHIKLGPNLHPAKAKGLAVATPHATGKKSRRVFRQEVVRHATKHEIALLQGI